MQDIYDISWEEVEKILRIEIITENKDDRIRYTLNCDRFKMKLQQEYNKYYLMDIMATGFTAHKSIVNDLKLRFIKASNIENIFGNIKI